MWCVWLLLPFWLCCDDDDTIIGARPMAPFACCIKWTRPVSPLNVNPLPLLTNDNFPLRNRLAAPFDPACRMFNSAPPGNLAMSEELLLLLLLLLLLFVVVVVVAELPPLTSSLCSWAPVAATEVGWCNEFAWMRWTANEKICNFDYKSYLINLLKKIAICCHPVNNKLAHFNFKS